MTDTDMPSMQSPACPHCGMGMTAGICANCPDPTPPPSSPPPPDPPTVIEIDPDPRRVELISSSRLKGSSGAFAVHCIHRHTALKNGHGREHPDATPMGTWRLFAAGGVVAISIAVVVVIGITDSARQGYRSPADYSVLAPLDTDSATIDLWARQTFGPAANDAARSRRDRERTSIMQALDAARFAEPGSRCWNEIALLANRAHAIGTFDSDMLEIAADLHVQIAIHADLAVRFDRFERIARARQLLETCLADTTDPLRAARLDRKISELDALVPQLKNQRSVSQ